MEETKYCICGTERVEIESAVLDKLVQIFNVKMSTVEKTSKPGWLSVCPRCDAYRLGVDLNEIFPLYTQSGEATDIRTLVKTPDFWES